MKITTDISRDSILFWSDIRWRVWVWKAGVVNRALRLGVRLFVRRPEQRGKLLTQLEMMEVTLIAFERWRETRLAEHRRRG